MIRNDDGAGKASVEPAAVADDGIDEVQALANRVHSLDGKLRGEDRLLARLEIDRAHVHGVELSGLEHDVLHRVREARGLHAVEHHVADADHAVHRLTVGFGINDVAQPVEIMLRIEAVGILQQRLARGVDRNGLGVRVIGDRRAKELCHRLRREDDLSVQRLNAALFIQGASVGGVILLAAGKLHLHTVHRVGHRSAVARSLTAITINKEVK